MAVKQTIGSALITRLHQLGVRHIFGIPGDYVLGLYKLIEQSPIQHIGTTREDAAGYAADAYARINGIGAICVTYCVGGLNVVNAIACAYAERSPVVVLTGSPGLSERVHNPYLHHMVKDFSTQKEVFEKMTVATVVLDDPHTAEREMDRAFSALRRYKRPVYIEVPRDLVNVPLPQATHPVCAEDAPSNQAALAEAVSEVRTMLEAAKRPVLLVGAELGRFGLEDQLLKLAERLNVPVASTLLGKSVIREDHPLYVGIYGGLIGRDEVQQFVNDSDCLLILGTHLTDIEDVSVNSPLIAEGRTVHATSDRIAVKHHRYEDVRFDEFVRMLSELLLKPFPRRSLPGPEPVPLRPTAESDTVTLHGVFMHVNSVLDDKTLVIADVGEALFAAADLRVHRRFEFIAPAYYTSMGFAVPAAVGVGFADPVLRPIVLVGDGAFQMTGTELSTCVRHKLSPILIVLNNRGYSTEREIMEGPFNDIHDWRYEKVCELLGSGVGYRIRTHGEFVRALSTALADRSQVHVLNVLLDQADRSPGMVRLARRLARRLAGK